jgi:16S rRNA (cytosine967-C5)-methyltransferase
VKPLAADAVTWPAAGSFDRALVDAPCSGLGTLRQHPEVKWRRTPADITTLAGLQTQLLLRLAACVRPGGILVYATCTISEPENKSVVAVFLQQQPAFTLDDARAVLPDHARTLVGSDGALRTLPHRHGLDGFFAVRLKRRAEHGIVCR